MSAYKKYIGDLFLSTRFYGVTLVCIFAFVLSFFLPPLQPIAEMILFIFITLALADYIFLFFTGSPPLAKRILAERFSNGDANVVNLEIVNNHFFVAHMEIIDELPYQFQKRDWMLTERFLPGQQKSITYLLRPLQRGEYQFGYVIVYAKTLLGLVKRRHRAGVEVTVPVYPSFLQLKKYELMTRSTIQSPGSAKMRKIGHSMEFEQIKEYVTGDDVRSVNWKATARRSSLMVNNYTDEKSQQVYCIIDKGRLMKMPFNGLTLLDYAINSTLVLANVCLQKQDKTGLISFSNKIGTILAADRKPVQRDKIMQLLYAQKTDFLESDYEMLYLQIRNRIKQRSLLILYTNFESLSGLHRQLPYLRSIARHHLLLVVFFENTELEKLSMINAENLEEIYIKTVAEKFAFEKRLIVKELMKYGILSILTTPEKLTVNTVNKYLELKARQAV